MIVANGFEQLPKVKKSPNLVTLVATQAIVEQSNFQPNGPAPLFFASWD